MNPFLWLVDTIITLYIWMLIAAAVLSWLVAFNVVNTRNPIVHRIGDFLYRVTEPAAAADPHYAAQSRRHRHFAGDPDPALLFIENVIVWLYSRCSSRCAAISGRAMDIGAAGGVALAVRLTPKGGRDSIDGIELLADGRSVLKARVRAAPSEGEANDALCRLLAKAVGVPPRDVALTAGATARIKRLDHCGRPAHADRGAGEDRRGALSTDLIGPAKVCAHDCAQLIDGKTISADLRGKVTDAVHRLRRDRGIVPGWRSCWSARIRPAKSMSATSPRR